MNNICAKSVKFLIIAVSVLGWSSLGPTENARADEVTIKCVDNYGGNSNVTTNKPDTTVFVTALDADGKPVESWTGTTDSSGKLTIRAGYKLSQPYLKVRSASSNRMFERVVVPDGISGKQPVTFAVPGSVEGEVIDVKTVDGEVVATKKADRYGRVFLAAGLAAGTYLITSPNHDKPANKVLVKPKLECGSVTHGPLTLQPLQVQNQATIKIKKITAGPQSMGNPR